MAETEDERRLSPEALEALGLERQPFAGAPPVPPDEDDETRVNLALSVLDARATPLLVSGVPGSGRTHFLRQIRDAAETIRAQPVDARSEDPAAALVAAGSRRGPQALLVDNADALGEADLAALLRQARELDCGLALAVDETATATVAEQAAEALELAEPPPVLRLPPFSEQKTRIYVDHRITAAGGSPSRLLRAADYRRIHRLSEGLPGRIDTAAAAVLRGRTHAGAASWLSGRWSTVALAGGALAVAALSLVLVNPFQADEPESFEAPAEQETASVDITRDAEDEGGSATGDDDGQPSAPEASDAPEPNGDAAVAAVEADALPGAEDASAATDLWSVPDPLAALPEPEATAEGAATTGEAEPSMPPIAGDEEPAGEADSGIPMEPLAAADSDPAQDGADTEAADEAETQGSEDAASAEAETETDADAVAAEEDDGGGGAGDAEDGTNGDAEWFASRADGHYTIQLLAARERSTVERFLEQNPEIADEVRVVPGQRDGEDWYRLFMGDYADRDDARAALEALPEGARGAGAWTPTFGSLREG